MWHIAQRISKTSLCWRSRMLKARHLSKSGLMCTQATKQDWKKFEETNGNTPPPRFRFLWKFLGVSVIGAFGVVGYAWYDTEFRKKLENHVPYSADALSFIFQHFITNDAIQSVQDAETSRISDPKKFPDPEIVQEDKASAVLENTKEVKQKKRMEEQNKARLALQKREEEEAAKNKELEFILDRLLVESKKIVESAVSTQKSAAQAILEHTQKLKHAMETTGTESEWDAVIDTQQSRADAIWTSDTATERARLHLDKLRSAVIDGKANSVTKKNKALVSAEEELNNLNYLLRTAATEVSKAQSEAKVMSEYRDLVKKGKERFIKELESILPPVKSGELQAGSHLTEDELNCLIAHAHRRIDQLQKQLVEQQLMEQQRLAKALERQKEEDSKLTDEMVSREKDHMTAEQEILKHKWDSDARVQFEMDLRSQLSRQAAAHSDHIVEVLKVQERELKAKFKLQLSEHIRKEKENFQQQVAEWVARLHGIEAALDSRVEMEKQGRKAQELWLACQTLQSVIDKGRKEGRTWEEQLKPLNSEVRAIRETCTINPMILTILEAIPEAAIWRGVWTETALTERFEKVNRVCKHVAMIDESGGSLFKFVISYIQSFFVFPSTRVFNSSEEVNPRALSTFVLLDNARHSLEHNDLEQAVRYVNQLRGQPRFVAADWLLEAKLRLETKQASEVLLAYASAVGLGSLF